MNRRNLLLTGAGFAALSAAPAGALAQAQAATAPTAAPSSPMLAKWTGPYGGVPPWDKIRPDLFPAAFEEGLALQRAEVAAIAGAQAAPTFENTIAALNDYGRAESRAEVMFFGVMSDNLSSPEVQAIEAEWSPKIAAASDEITFNEGLFARVKAVHDQRDNSGLNAEQKRLTERIYRSFVRNGANLDAAQKKQLGDINQQLAGAFTEFSKKVLADENTWTVIDNEADLAGLAESFKSSARAAAEERGLAGKWVIVNTRSSVDPFLAASSNRALREKVWRKFKMRGDNGDANDTKAVIAQIVKLRADRARLLGFASHAHWRMDDTMAKDPQKALDLTLRVWKPAVARVKEEVADMQAIATREGAGVTIEPWDYVYYAEKVRKAKYDLDQNELKPYLELENMVKAAFWSAEQRYDITFTEITGQIPVFHPDVRVFEVRDKPSGAHRAVFYLDNFARPGKRSGAWHLAYRVNEKFRGKVTAISSNNNNFVKAAAGEPVLISLDDAITLFHEFGHALHYMLFDLNYPGFASNQRDFVEFPSQVNERWILTREVLDRFARHYKTGQPMPQALVDKVKNARKFNQGYASVETLSSTLLDMILHMDPSGVVDPAAFEREQLAKLGMPKEMAMRHRLPQFNHLFTSDSYSAGYYSYLWSDVMAADAWGAWVEAGDPWDKATTQRFRKHILSNGNSIDRAEAYRLFRGRDPDVKALLEDRGFPVG